MHDLGLLLIGLGAGIAGPVGGVVSLVSFPALLALGFSPLVANVTNTVGVVVPGTISSSHGYRREIQTPSRILYTLLIASGVGGLAGGLLLQVLGERVFTDAVPVLLIIGAVLIIVQPIVVKRVSHVHTSKNHMRIVVSGTFVAAIYAGYFGAGAGVLWVGLFATLLRGGIQRANALKSIVGLASNITAAIYFAVALPVNWSAAGFLAIGSIAGGQLGVHIAKRLPDAYLRAGIAIGGVALALTALH